MINNYDKTKLIYADSKNGEITRKVYVDFTDGIESFRKSRTINRCDDFVDINATKNWIFISEDSDYLNWTLERAIYNKEELNCKHYLFVTDEEIIEILSSAPPTIIVEYINKPA